MAAFTQGEFGCLTSATDQSPNQIFLSPYKTRYNSCQRQLIALKLHLVHGLDLAHDLLAHLAHTTLASTVNEPLLPKDNCFFFFFLKD